MKKKEFLKKINDGFERGAKIKLAKILGVKGPSVVEWFNGRSKPSEQNVQKMAGLFSIPEQELWDMFNSTEEDIPQDVVGSILAAWIFAAPARATKFLVALFCIYGATKKPAGGSAAGGLAWED